MNKTISINIGGFVFNIEENAYQKLFHYLNSIKKNFTEEDEREEIMNDIEARNARFFYAVGRIFNGCFFEVFHELRFDIDMNMNGKHFVLLIFVSVHFQ